MFGFAFPKISNLGNVMRKQTNSSKILYLMLFSMFLGFVHISNMFPYIISENIIYAGIRKQIAFSAKSYNSYLICRSTEI